MTTRELALALWGIASLAAYIGSCVWLARKADKIPLQRDEQHDDERAQRRRY